MSLRRLFPGFDRRITCGSQRLALASQAGHLRQRGHLFLLARLERRLERRQLHLRRRDGCRALRRTRRDARRTGRLCRCDLLRQPPHLCLAGRHLGLHAGGTLALEVKLTLHVLDLRAARLRHRPRAPLQLHHAQLLRLLLRLADGVSDMLVQLALP